jgi:arylsulfatase A-like enzyme
VPLLIRVPNHAAGVCDSLVSSLDIGPTLLAQANVPGFYGMQGVDASALLDKPETKVRSEILIEEDQLNDLLGVGQALRMRTLITADTRLTVYQGYQGVELFDLDSDPDEINNRVEDTLLRSRMMERLTYAQMSNTDISPKPSAFA